MHDRCLSGYLDRLAKGAGMHRRSRSHWKSLNLEGARRMRRVRFRLGVTRVTQIDLITKRLKRRSASTAPCHRSTPLRTGRVQSAAVRGRTVSMRVAQRNRTSWPVERPVQHGQRSRWAIREKRVAWMAVRKAHPRQEYSHPKQRTYNLRGLN